MDLNKHKILMDIYNVTKRVESLGASEELTAIVCDLGDIRKQAEELISAIKNETPPEWSEIMAGCDVPND